MNRPRARQEEYTLERLHAIDQYLGLVEVLQERFITSQVDVPFAILQDTIDRLVAQDDWDATEQMVIALHHLAMDPVARPDEALAAALTTFEVGEDDVVLEGMTRYYVRSMQFTQPELHQVMARYRDDYADTLLVDHVEDKMAHHPQNAFFYMRYVGATSDNTPFGRHQQDLQAAHLGGRRVLNFVATVRQVYPDKVFQVYDLPLLLTPGVFGQAGPASAQVDAIERILIHLLDRGTLLNSQPGGFYISYAASPDDIALTHTISAPNAVEYLIGDVADDTHPQADPQLLVLFEEYRTELAGVDPVMAGRMTAEHLELLALQMLPHTDRIRTTRQTGTVPLVVLGKDITQEDFSLQRAFFAGSRAGTITADLIRLALNGMQHQPLQQHQGLHLRYPCFGDLWPVPKQDYFWDMHIGALSRLLAHVNPTVVVTLGFDVARVAHSNFHDRYSLPSPRYQEMLGEPVLINHDAAFSYEDAPEGEEPQQGWCVAVTHMHPGTANYGNVDPRLLRFMFLCWVRTLLLVDVAVGLAEGVPAALPGSRAFAQQVLETWNDREPAALANAIHQARADVNDLRSNMQAERYRALLQRNEGLPVGIGVRDMGETSRRTLEQKWERYGFAEGPVGSNDRIQHYVRLSRYQWPELLSCPSYSTDREAFRHWFVNQLESGANVLQAILRRSQEEHIDPVGGLTRMQVHYLRGQCKPPAGWPADDDSWMLEPEARESAMEAARIRFLEKYGGPNSEPNPALSRQRRNEYLAAQGNIAYSTFAMCRVRVSSQKARFRVIVDGQQVYAPNGVYVHQSVGNGIRFLDYDPELEPHGLLVRDEFGNILPTPQQPFIIWDHWLLRLTPETYFVTFRRTVEEHGQVLRQGILNQLELDQGFNYGRILDLYWQQVCGDGERIIFTVRARVPADAEGDSYMADALRQVVAANGIGIEELVWNHLLSSEGTYFRTVRPILQALMVGRGVAQGIQRVPRRYANVSPHGAYILPQYVPPPPPPPPQ